VHAGHSRIVHFPIERRFNQLYKGRWTDALEKLTHRILFNRFVKSSFDYTIVMRFFALAAVASLANAVSLDFNKRESTLDVKLELTGNTAVKALITNTGSEDLKVLKTGSFLDDAAVEKVDVFQGGKLPDPHPSQL
jgi:hypothetical protein